LDEDREIHQHGQGSIRPQAEVEAKRLMSLNMQEIVKQTNIAFSKCLREKGYVSVIDVLMEMGKLSKEGRADWRFRRVPHLEKVVYLNLAKINLIIKTIRKNAREMNLKIEQDALPVLGKGPKRLLQFGKYGHPYQEEAYSTHFLRYQPQVK
jgi:hypothetical protein